MPIRWRHLPPSVPRDPKVTDFERDFPSLCFALATGVGKTRLMGAFITYLYLSGTFPPFLRSGAEHDDLRQADR